MFQADNRDSVIVGRLLEVKGKFAWGEGNSSTVEEMTSIQGKPGPAVTSRQHTSATQLPLSHPQPLLHPTHATKLLRTIPITPSVPGPDYCSSSPASLQSLLGLQRPWTELLISGAST